jgi:glyoxylase-like metal-dependent hydrolase (beta-lactamase superfamily II)
MTQSDSAPKAPWLILDHLYSFSPNRDTLGGTPYLIVKNQGNILIDSPAWNGENQQFLHHQGGVDWLIITHRGSLGKATAIQKATHCRILIQEQEAYLLPEAKVTTFEKELNLSRDLQVIWTPGHSPGSACVYWSSHGGVLFTGRHLLPNTQGQPVPLRTAKTFHWLRQLKSVERLIQQFNQETLHYICPGANIGFLRGQRIVDRAYEKLTLMSQRGSLCTESQSREEL